MSYQTYPYLAKTVNALTGAIYMGAGAGAAIASGYAVIERSLALSECLLDTGKYSTLSIASFLATYGNQYKDPLIHSLVGTITASTQLILGYYVFPPAIRTSVIGIARILKDSIAGDAVAIGMSESYDLLSGKHDITGHLYNYTAQAVDYAGEAFKHLIDYNFGSTHEI